MGYDQAVPAPRSRRADRLYQLGIAALLAVFLIAKLPTLATPYYWDEAAAYVMPALWLADEGLHHALPGLHPPSKFFGHPPGTYAALAALYRVFGHDIRVAHAFAVALAVTALYLTYRVGRVVAGAEAGLLAAVLLALSPLFFAQAGMLHGDMTVTALGLAATLFYLQDRTRLYLLTATALVLSKETGVGIVAAIGAYHLLFRRERPARIREAALLLAPASALIAFFAATWLTSGQLLNNPYFAEHSLGAASQAQFRSVSAWLFERQGRWILTLVTALAFFELPRLDDKKLALMAILVLPFWLAFSLIYFLPRYLLAVFPYLCILAATALVALKRRGRWIPVAALLGTALIFAREVTGEGGAHGNYEMNLGYVQVVNVHVAAARWLETNHARSRIGAAWPLSLVLSHPRLGYVVEPLDIVPFIDQGERPDLLVWSSPGGSENRALLARASSAGWRPVKRFGSGAKTAVVFAPPTAP